METDIIESVRRAEHMRLSAMRENDANALGQLLSDDLVYLHSGGERDTKSSYLASMREGRLVYPRELNLQEETIGVLGAEVHVRARMTGTVIVNGTERHLNTHPLTVWREVSGAWLLVRFEATPAS